MAPSAAAPALCLALLLALPIDGERLPNPMHVRFAAETAHHLLRWEPGPGSPGDVSYDVEHGVYGTNFSWTAVPNCMRISEHSCDLTYYTLDPERRYYARVRAVSGNRTSLWNRTNSFSPKEASLRLSGQSLSVAGNTIHVKLQLLLKAGNRTVRYEDIQKHARRYKTYIRRVQDNKTYDVVETQPEFNIPNLFWGTEYCISVEPDVASRQIPATRTTEQCVTTGDRDRSAELLLSIVGNFCITALLLVLLGTLLVCMYIKKPMRPPSVLKSFLKQGSLWVEQEYFSPARLDADTIQQLILCQKAPQEPSSPAGSTGTLQQPPEWDCGLTALPEDRAHLLDPGAARSRDCSCTSTDSGICLHNSSSELGSVGRGNEGQLPTGEDSGISLERTSPCLARSSGASGCYQPVEERQPQQAEHGLPAATGDDGPQDVEFRGYLQQSKGTVEQRWDQGEGLPPWGRAGPAQDPGSTDVVLDIDCSELPVAKGYLKQASPEPPRSHTRDLAAPDYPWEPTAWGFPSQLGHQTAGAASCGAPGVPTASKASPDLLKAPFELSFSTAAPLGPLPLISSLSTNSWLALQMNPLSALEAGSKDSRL
ncbi:interleukin-10 receptor subunit alpha isoform X1 [Apteryx mantelli]|uniref:Interleukin-10 receptor subunit alpha isoform X1 n=1 Tax=Apteryx mantelli TaxID=2696672 RepID=A0ABM4FN84_9AVES